MDTFVPKRDVIKLYALYSGCAWNSWRGILEWAIVTGPSRTFPPSAQENDQVKSCGHASLFSEHNLPQRFVYVQESLQRVALNLKGDPL
ncbi:hypothetical protein ANANG_G00109710, partial [Anguilla anguilla]